MQVWSWRHAIQKSSLDSSTKLVLLNLSIYMNDVGDGCYPSIERQVQDTGLSKRSVITHLKKALEAGFLVKEKHGYAGQKWARNEYRASYPKGGANDDMYYEKVVQPLHKGGANDDQKVVQQLHTNSPYNSQVELSSKRARDPFGFIESSFKQVWNAYPLKRRGSISQARDRWAEIVNDSDPQKEAERYVEAIRWLVENHGDWNRAGGKYIPALHNFLDQPAYLEVPNQTTKGEEDDLPF